MTLTRRIKTCLIVFLLAFVSFTIFVAFAIKDARQNVKLAQVEITKLERFGYFTTEDEKPGWLTVFMIQLGAKPKDEAIEYWADSGTPEFDTKIANIGKVRSVRLIDLSCSGLSDHGLMHLHTLSELQWLNLEGTYVTSEGLRDLLENVRVKEINLSSYTLNQQQLTDLKERFPSVQFHLSDEHVTPWPRAEE